MNMRNLAKSLFKPLYGLRFGVMLLIGAQQITAVLQPYYMGKLIDQVQQPVDVLLRTAGILFGIVALDFFLDWTQNYLWFKMDFKSMFLMRSAMFEQLLKKPYAFFQKNKSGDMVSRIMDDAAQYAEKTIIKVPMLLANIMKLCIVFFMIFFLQPVVGCILFAMCVIYFFSYLCINTRLRQLTSKERERHSELLHKTNALYEGVLTIKLYEQESFFADDYRQAAGKLCQNSIFLQKWKSLAQSLGNTISNVMPVIAVVAGAFLAMAGKCTLGAIFSIYSYVSLLGEPIRNLTDYNIMVQRGKVNEERLEELLPKQGTCADEPCDARDCDAQSDGCLEKSDFRIESISLQQVGFAYEGQEPIFDRFGMEMKHGDRIGIVGRTGSGKSTLIRLMTGQIFAGEGAMLVNGRNIKDIAPSQYIKRVAIMPQDIFLYDDSVIANILFGRKPDAEQLERLRRRLKISSYEEQEVGQLSGGEKRRIGLARALLGDFDLLILDEPTSDVDPVTEQKIIELIDELITEDKMLLVITHRPAILDICKRVINLDEMR